MRILVVTPTYLPIIGGAEVGIYEIYRRIAVNNQVKILRPHLPLDSASSQAKNDPYYNLQALPVESFLDIFTFARTKAKKLWQNILPPISLSYVWALLRQIKRYQPDVINMHFAVPGGLALILADKLSDVPILLSLVSRSDVLHDANPDYKRHPGFYSSVLSHSTKATALTEYMVEKYSDKEQIDIVPYGVDTETFSPDAAGGNLRQRLQLPNDSRLLFTLQRLDPVKRIDLLLKAMQHLPDKTFLLIGGKGPHKKQLRALSEQLGIEQRVRFTGFISESDLPLYFAASELFLFSSQAETFGIVLAQALSSGTPVVALNSSCISDVVDHQKNGILVDSEDPADLAASIMQLLNNKEELASFSSEARAKALACYSWDRIADRYFELLQQLKQKDCSSDD